MEELHHIDMTDIFERAIKKYEGRSAKWLCDKAARLSKICDRTKGKDLDRMTECSIALMRQLKRLSEDELSMLKGYVYDKIEEGEKDYVAAQNVFLLKAMYGI